MITISQIIRTDLYRAISRTRIVSPFRACLEICCSYCCCFYVHWLCFSVHFLNCWHYAKRQTYFECMLCVSSHLVLSFFRFKDAREVYPSRKYEMFFWDNKATLAIKDTEPNDTGRYRCEVSNRLGRIESTGSLHVYSTSRCRHFYHLDEHFVFPKSLPNLAIS